MNIAIWAWIKECDRGKRSRLSAVLISEMCNYQQIPAYDLNTTQLQEVPTNSTATRGCNKLNTHSPRRSNINTDSSPSHDWKAGLRSPNPSGDSLSPSLQTHPAKATLSLSADQGATQCRFLARSSRSRCALSGSKRSGSMYI